MALGVSALEVKAFSLGLARSDRDAAEELWHVFAETKAVLAAVHVTWALALTGSEVDLEKALERSRDRVRALIARIDGVRLRNDASLASFAMSLRDFCRALGTGNEGALLTSGAVAYEAGRALANELWAFELAPEGAPLSAEVASTHEL